MELRLRWSSVVSMDFGMLMPLLAYCVYRMLDRTILCRATLLTVSPCALSAGPRVEKAFGILQQYIERRVGYCDLLRGV